MKKYIYSFCQCGNWPKATGTDYWPAWTNSHQHSMRDGWWVDRKHFPTEFWFVLISCQNEPTATTGWQPMQDGWWMSELETLFHQVPVPLNYWPEWNNSDQCTMMDDGWWMDRQKNIFHQVLTPDVGGG